MRHVRSAVLVALALAAVAVQVWIVVTAGNFDLARVGAPGLEGHSDIETFWRSARALLDRQDIYRTGAALPNLNPPLVTVLLAPLGLVDAAVAYKIMALVTFAVVVGCLALAAAELDLPGRVAVPATAAVLVSAPFLATVGLGQVYGFVLAALTAAWWAQRRDRPVLAAVALGVAVAAKPSLAPLLLLPLVRRQWSAAAVGAGTAAGLSAVGALVVGGGAARRWLELVLAQGTNAYFDNGSLPASLLRLTADNDWAVPLVRVPGGAVAGVVVGLGLCGLALWRCRAGADVLRDAGMWAVVAAALLASPLAWNTYHVVLVPGVIIVLARDLPAGAALLALVQVGQEWPSLWYGADLAPALPLCLYTASFALHYAFLVRRPTARPSP